MTFAPFEYRIPDKYLSEFSQEVILNTKCSGKSLQEASDILICESARVKDKIEVLYLAYELVTRNIIINGKVIRTNLPKVSKYDIQSLSKITRNIKVLYQYRNGMSGEMGDSINDKVVIMEGMTFSVVACLI